MARLTLDRERTVAYTWGAIKRLHKEHKVDFLKLVSAEEEWYFNPEQFSLMLWCGLVDEEPTLTVERVDSLITLPKLAAITDAMLRAVSEAVTEGNPPTPSTS